ncbi:MAG: phosphoglucosamine mutase [Spirochaetota bacterium]|nr:phosphoglucosamine mutase [Spirochaetota bacterium]
MSTLKISLSGVRGIIGDTLTPTVISDFGSAFGTYLNSLANQDNTNKAVAIGMDTRVSGEMVKHTIISSLIATGNTVLDLGIVPTPSTILAVREKNLAGGIVITASHNPMEWNGLKFISPEGRFLDSHEWNQVFNIYNNKSFNYKHFNEIGTLCSTNDANDMHINKVLNLIDTDKIKHKKLKVAYDPVNGAGSIIIQSLLERLGCDIYSINTDTKRGFCRSPEPLAENIKDLEKLVLENNCDIGFALDPDADRLAIVSDKAKAIGEEYTLVLALDQYLKLKKSDIVVNISTSRMIDDIAKKYAVNVMRTPVGEINVVKKMMDNNCDIGGEGNGGVIIPEINRCRDSLVAIVMVLKAITDENVKISEYIKRFNEYYFYKSKMEIGSIDPNIIYSRLKAHISKQINIKHSISLIDGMKIDYDDYWIQIRESNTEPIIRIFVEAKSEQLAKSKVDEFKNLCYSMM